MDSFLFFEILAAIIPARCRLLPELPDSARLETLPVRISALVMAGQDLLINIPFPGAYKFQYQGGGKAVTLFP